MGQLKAYLRARKIATIRARKWERHCDAIRSLAKDNDHRNGRSHRGKQAQNKTQSVQFMSQKIASATSFGEKHLPVGGNNVTISKRLKKFVFSQICGYSALSPNHLTSYIGKICSRSSVGKRTQKHVNKLEFKILAAENNTENSIAYSHNACFY